MIQIKNLNIYTKEKNKQILNNINFSIDDNIILGITGESGAGKSMITKSIIRLLPENNFLVNGEILIDNDNVLDMSNKQLRCLRGSKVGIIFQNPMTAFNPIIKIGKQMVETIRSHNKITKKNARQDIINVLKNMNLDDVERIMNSFPYQLSGGMMQRVVIANTLLLKPNVLIADEPTTALDKDTKLIIINELLNIKNKYNLTLVIVSHDYELLKEICDKLLIVKSGEVVKFGDKRDVLNCNNEYVEKLFNSKLVVN